MRQIETKGGKDDKMLIDSEQCS